MTWTMEYYAAVNTSLRRWRNEGTKGGDHRGPWALPQPSSPFQPTSCCLSFQHLGSVTSCPTDQSFPFCFLCTSCIFLQAKLSHSCARLVGLRRNVEQHPSPRDLEHPLLTSHTELIDTKGQVMLSRHQAAQQLPRPLSPKAEGPELDTAAVPIFSIGKGASRQATSSSSLFQRRGHRSI